MGPYVIKERIGTVVYRLALPSELYDFHDVFHVSVLRKVVREPELILPHPPADAQRNLSLVSKPVKIVDEKEVDNRGWKEKLVLVRWERDGIHEDERKDGARRTRAPSRRLLDSVSCKQLRSELQGKTVISSSMSLEMTDPKPSSLL